MKQVRTELIEKNKRVELMRELIRLNTKVQAGLSACPGIIEEKIVDYIGKISNERIAVCWS